MTNPYQSPDSEVQPLLPRPERPFNLKIAVALFMATVILSAVGIFAFGGVKATDAESVLSAIFTYTIIFIGLALAYSGRNWARILFIVYLVIKFFFRGWFVITVMSSAIVSIKLFAFVLMVLDVFIIYFLLHKKTSIWYAEIKKYRAR